MKFENKYPKQETTVEKSRPTLSKIDDVCRIHYRDYKGYLDTVKHYLIEGDYNAWINGIREQFKYDEMMQKVKNVYTDSLGRNLTVKELTK